ncbi:MAG: flagellar basal body-associated FliL family protein [Acidobacteriota bacterium]
MKIALLAVAFLVVGGGAAAGYLFMQKGADHAEAAEDGEEAPTPKKKRKPSAPSGLLSFEPFLVNLADPGSARYLRTTLKLVVPAEIAATASKDDVVLMQLRSAILELLAEQTADPLVTPSGKSALKQAIQTRAGEIVGDEVIDVLFSDFVVQF